MTDMGLGRRTVYGRRKHRRTRVVIKTQNQRMVRELDLYVSQLTSKHKATMAVKHALDVQRSLALGNYHAFFDQYLNAPNMGA